MVDGNRYTSRYELKVDHVEKVVSEDNIIEPGEPLKISLMDILNFGGMPTPVHQQVVLSLSDNQWVRFNPIDAVNIPHSVHPNGHYLLSRPLEFAIKDFTGTAVDRVFFEKANVDYRARVERVNKEFKAVAK